MFFRLRDLPELRHLGAAERRQLLRSCVGRFWTPHAVARSLALGVLGALPLPMLLLDTPRVPVSVAATAITLAFAIVALGSYWFTLVRVRGQIVGVLEDARRSGVLPICPRCGYDLRASTGHGCPECGAATGPPSE